MSDIAPMPEDTFTIAKGTDGNWTGQTVKFGKSIEVRDIDPQTVLIKLMTHE